MIILSGNLLVFKEFLILDYNLKYQKIKLEEKRKWLKKLQIKPKLT